MPASKSTRYHEAAHAFAAVYLGIGLRGRGIVLNSDQEAYTEVNYKPHEPTLDWCIRRAAVMLAAPAARILEQGQEWHWDTVRSKGEYQSDFDQAKKLLHCCLKMPFDPNHPDESNSSIDQLMNCAMKKARECVEPNAACIEANTQAMENSDSFSIEKIQAVIETCSQGG